MLSECGSVSCVCKKVRRRARKTAENRKQFERKQGQFFHFFDGKALENTENERNMNKCKIFLQKILTLQSFYGTITMFIYQIFGQMFSF